MADQTDQDMERKLLTDVSQILTGSSWERHGVILRKKKQKAKLSLG